VRVVESRQLVISRPHIAGWQDIIICRSSIILQLTIAAVILSLWKLQDHCHKHPCTLTLVYAHSLCVNYSCLHSLISISSLRRLMAWHLLSTCCNRPTTWHNQPTILGTLSSNKALSTWLTSSRCCHCELAC
jgi:hypothetical protein